MIGVIRETGQLRNRKGQFGWRVQDAARGLSLSGVSHQPLLDACREIKRVGGVPGDEQIALCREGRDGWDLACSLEWGAAHTVEENNKIGPRFRKWQPFSASSMTGEQHEPHGV